MKETRYQTKPFYTLTEEELAACSQLYSSYYGIYNGEDGKHAKGQRIQMSSSLYKRLYSANKNVFISMCYSQSNELLGHAIFLRKEIEGKGKCSWVLQLVVNSRYRNRRIATNLLQSAWGFSDYYAWGLATANAITLKTLESVTWRSITVDDIVNNMPLLEQLIDEVPFADKSQIITSSKVSQIFTNFYPELEKSNLDPSLQVYATRLGKIQPGYEWLAFTFSTQEMTYSEEKLRAFLEFSEQQLQEAYSRMNMPEQKWTKGTVAEIDYVLQNASVSADSRILDIGCGQGRHTIELAKRGYHNVTGIDFSESNIAKARQASHDQDCLTTFLCADARKYKTGVKSDLVLCLYDVIGSFRDQKDNRSIIRTIKGNLKHGGRAVISVMNMELTESLAIHRQSLRENPKSLLKLPPSDTMEASGNVFNPDYYLINTDDGLVYRKEQFTSDHEVFAEYVIGDKRYTLNEISQMFQAEGFNIVDARYVQAGHWDAPLANTDPKAKEILLIVEY